MVGAAVGGCGGLWGAMCMCCCGRTLVGDLVCAAMCVLCWVTITSQDPQQMMVCSAGERTLLIAIDMHVLMNK